MIVMLIDVWDVQAIDALDDELAFRIRVANVATSRNRQYVRLIAVLAVRQVSARQGGRHYNFIKNSSSGPCSGRRTGLVAERRDTFVTTHHRSG